MTNEITKICGYDCKLVEDELRIFYRDSVICFRWSLAKRWTGKLLRWHILDRLGLRHPDLLPPPSSESYQLKQNMPNG